MLLWIRHDFNQSIRHRLDTFANVERTLLGGVDGCAGRETLSLCPRCTESRISQIGLIQGR